MFQPSVLLDAAVLLVIAVAGKIVVGVRRRRHPQRPPADRPRHDPARRGRPDLRQHRAGPGRARRRAVRRPAARRADDDGHHPAAAALADRRQGPGRRRRAGRGRRRPSRPTGGPRRATAGSCLDGRPPSQRGRRRRPRRPPRSPTTARPSDELLLVVRRPARRRRRLDARRHRTRCSTCCATAGRGPCACSTSPGVLERGVPVVAEALARRRADPSELDPGRALRFPTVARLADRPVDPTVPWDPGAQARGHERDPRGAGDRRARHRRVDAGAIHELLAELAVDGPADRSSARSRRPACCAPRPATSTATTAPR